MAGCEQVDDRHGWKRDVGGVNGWKRDTGGVNGRMVVRRGFVNVWTIIRHGWMRDMVSVNGWMIIRHGWCKWMDDSQT